MRVRPSIQTAPQVVSVNIILDKSGSMFNCVTDTIGGINAYLSKLKEDINTDYVVSLTQFNTNVENVYVGVPLEMVPLRTAENYKVKGGTALLDAVGNTVQKLDQLVKADKYLVVVITDGAENSSKEWSAGRIKDLIGSKTAGGWTFVYMGADQNAWANAKQYGFAMNNSLSYGKGQTMETMDVLCRSTQNYVGKSGGADSNFFGNN